MSFPFRHPRRVSHAAGVLAGLLLSATAVSPSAAEPVVQELPGSGAAERLSEALSVLASNDGDALALTAAGNAALDLNDENAAFGFFARANVVAPRNPEVKVGLGRVLVRIERPDEALLRFREAVSLGADARSFALDRGLAQDLRGDYVSAQADYRLAAQSVSRDEVTRRLGLSQAIGGDTRAGLATLAPLVARNDAAAWRARAFVLAMDGDVAGARAIAQARMSPGVAGLFERFFVRLPGLNPAERARAVHFGDMPAPGQHYASVQPGSSGTAFAQASPPPQTASRARGGALIPQGRALGRNRAALRPAESARTVAVGRGRPKGQPPATRVVQASPAVPTGPVPLPTPFQVTLPTPRPTLVSVASASPSISAPVPAAIAASGPTPAVSAPVPFPAPAPPASAPPPVVIASVAEEARTSASVAPPQATPAVSAAIVNVDPDGALRPGDQVITPAGPIVQPDGASVPLAGVRNETPESLLPPGALPDVATAAATVAPAPRPGFDSAATAVPEQPETKGGRTPASPFGPPTPSLKSVTGTPLLKATPKPADTPKVTVKSDKTVTAGKAKAAGNSDAKAKTEVADKGASKAKVATAKTASEAKTTRKAKVEPKAPPVPERYWFQIATGANAKALAFDLKRLKKKHDLIAKLDGFSAEYGSTRRLVVGPFKTEAEAKAFEVKARASGLDGYVWISPDGREVDPLPGQ